MLLQVSVGRLGVITQLSLSIMPQQAVQRAEQDMTAAQFAQQVKQVQDAYTQAKQSGSSEAIWTALHSLNETQVQGAWVYHCRAAPSCQNSVTSLNMCTVRLAKPRSITAPPDLSLLGCG